MQEALLTTPGARGANSTTCWIAASAASFCPVSAATIASKHNPRTFIGSSFSARPTSTPAAAKSRALTCRPASSSNCSTDPLSMHKFLGASRISKVYHEFPPELLNTFCLVLAAEEEDAAVGDNFGVDGDGAGIDVV